MELTRTGILGTVAVFLVAAACVRLGFWQLDRREQRLERNQAVAARLAEDPVQLVSAVSDTTGLPHRRARVEGRYDHDRSIVLGGRSHLGAPGVHLFTPLRLNGGAILVNRGWLPAADAATVDLHAVPRPDAGSVVGILLPFPDVALPAPDTFQTRWFRLAGEAVRAQYPYPVAQVYIQVTAAPSTAGPPLPLPPPALDAGPHLSYAVQWFSFATIFLVGWLVLAARGQARSPQSRSAAGP